MVDTFATRLRARREARRLSAPELAEAAGVSRQYLWALEAGAKAPSLETARRLAEVLDVSLDDLAGRDLPAR
jgi:transcriptional regulator with XRE-family HTH domain